MVDECEMDFDLFGDESGGAVGGSFSEDVAAAPVQKGPKMKRHVLPGGSAEARKRKRLQNKKGLHGGSSDNRGSATTGGGGVLDVGDDDSKLARMLLQNEDELLNFVAQVNQVYQEKLKKPAPFMTFILIGMQSSGKSTIVERFLRRCINIVKEGTGTRCPLDITCIHDDSKAEPVCELSGNELTKKAVGKNLSVSDVFKAVTAHNEKLASEDKFSSESVYLIVRSKQVQNMRFVDLPGIISNKSKGIDNRDDIKKILRNEIKKPNTRMCVLLEPKEFATNPIVDFIDETLGGRESWVDKATFFMTKFDMRLDDSRSGSKANAFFEEFRANGVIPFMVITPTLASEKLKPDELFAERQKVLESADTEEKRRFGDWLDTHQSFLATHPSDELLEKDYRDKISFKAGVHELRKQMLEDTARRLPHVFEEIRKQLKECENEDKKLRERQKYNDPGELKLIVSQVLLRLVQRIFTYLDGSLEIAMKFPDRLQTLEDEIEEEDNSDWATRELNHFTEFEDAWREHIAEMEGNVAVEVQAEQPFLGGKQYQRAMQFFRSIMIDKLPEPHNLKEFVPMATGYLSGGLQRENWERAMVEITKCCVKQVTHPGINYFVKHVGSIFRRLFQLAIEDVKTGEEWSATFQLLPPTVEKFLKHHFDNMLWQLMVGATEKTHCSLEPMYTTVNPNLPTFVQAETQRFNQKKEDQKYVFKNNTYVQVKTRQERQQESWFENMKSKWQALTSGSGEEAKKHLREENRVRAQTKKEFLSDKRTSMITEEETELILQRSFEYITALMEFNLVNLEFQFNHYLYQGFKDELQTNFSTRLLVEADWNKLVERDPKVQERLEELRGQIDGLRESLQQVSKMQSKLR